MRKLNTLGLLVGITITWTWTSLGLSQQVPEIPRRFMRGIAKVEQTSRGPVIFYNPATCRRLGPEACAFFRAHEYAHIRLNHLNRNISVRQAEAEADMYAARMVPRSTSAAAQRFFRRGFGGSANHGTPWQRARRVRNASMGGFQAANQFASRRIYPARSSYAATRGRIIRPQIRYQLPQRTQRFSGSGCSTHPVGRHVTRPFYTNTRAIRPANQRSRFFPWR